MIRKNHVISCYFVFCTTFSNTFEGSSLAVSKPILCKQIFIMQEFPTSTRCAHLCTVLTSEIQQMSLNRLVICLGVVAFCDVWSKLFRVLH